MNNKYPTICIKCRKERFVSRAMIYFIKIGKSQGRCKSCAETGSRKGIGRIHSLKTRIKMRLASFGKPKSLKHRENMSKARSGVKLPQISGPNHYLWIEDRTLLKDDHKDRGGQLHRDWSKRVKDRDGWKCKISNQDYEGRMEAHHILGWSEHPELRYELNNGITLCHAHHPKKRAEETELVPVFQGLIPAIAN